MTPKQESNYVKMLSTLRKIGNKYHSPSKLRKEAKMYGLSYNEILEIAYENIQEEAKFCLKGIRSL
uniref:Uncharacterized protein n=1 Tax=viral metagenome TaxID=1070528 RepID=A0A6M3LD86_9ZZZZ